MKLCISLATRGRPEQLLDTVRRSVANLALGQTAFMVQLDADDAASLAVSDHLHALDYRIRVNVAEREDTIAGKWNRALSEPADLYLVAADDDPYITPQYDAKLLAAAQRFPDGIGMVYGHMANASFSGVVAPTRKLCEKMGNRIFPEYFPYWFVDHWTDDVARIIGRLSFADVQTDQSKVGKTQEMREPAWWATWFDAAYLMRRSEARKIILDSEFCSPEWLKDILLSHHPLIEWRSRWVNNNVRMQSRQLEHSFGAKVADERYQRVRQRAVDMIPHILEEQDYGMHPGEAEQWRAMLIPPTNVVGLKQAFA